MTPQYLTTVIYHMLEITTLMVFLYGIKKKMYIHNFTAFITVGVFGFSFGLSYLIPKDFFGISHYLLMIFLLIFYVFYGVYKKHKRLISCNTDKSIIGVNNDNK